MPLIRNVYICREDAGYLIFIFVASFFATPNAFINPTLCMFWWAMVLLGLNSIREDNLPIKKSKSRLKAEIREKDKSIEGYKTLTHALFKIIQMRGTT